MIIYKIYGGFFSTFNNVIKEHMQFKFMIYNIKD